MIVQVQGAERHPPQALRAPHNQRQVWLAEYDPVSILILLLIITARRKPNYGNAQRHRARRERPAARPQGRQVMAALWARGKAQAHQLVQSKGPQRVSPAAAHDDQVAPGVDVPLQRFALALAERLIGRAVDQHGVDTHQVHPAFGEHFRGDDRRHDAFEFRRGAEVEILGLARAALQEPVITPPLLVIRIGRVRDNQQQPVALCREQGEALVGEHAAALPYLKVQFAHALKAGPFPGIDAQDIALPGLRRHDDGTAIRPIQSDMVLPLANLPAGGNDEIAFDGAPTPAAARVVNARAVDAFDGDRHPVVGAVSGAARYVG